MSNGQDDELSDRKTLLCVLKVSRKIVLDLICISHLTNFHERI